MLLDQTIAWIQFLAMLSPMLIGLTILGCLMFLRHEYLRSSPNLRREEFEASWLRAERDYLEQARAKKRRRHDR